MFFFIVAWWKESFKRVKMNKKKYFHFQAALLWGNPWFLLMRRCSAGYNQGVLAPGLSGFSSFLLLSKHIAALWLAPEISQSGRNGVPRPPFFIAPPSSWLGLSATLWLAGPAPHILYESARQLHAFSRVSSSRARPPPPFHLFIVWIIWSLTRHERSNQSNGSFQELF